MKKILAFINVLALISMMGKPILAADIAIESWTISYVGSGAEDINREKNFAALTDEYYFEDTYAMVIKYPDCVTDGTILVENDISSELPAGTYTMSFYARGSVSANYTTAGIGEGYQYNINADNWTVESSIPGADTRNWKKYSKEIEYGGGNDKLCFIFKGWTNGWDIDNISLVDENGTEYVQNGGFESVSETIVSEYDSATYDPVNFIASPFSGGVAISWKNPSTANLKDIKLYDVTSGEDVLLSEDFSNEPSDFNTYKMTKLTNGGVYQYKLYLSYRDGTESEYFAFGLPSATDKQYTPWGITMSRGAIGYAPLEISVDAKEKYEGNASFKFVSNIKGTISNVFVLVTQNVPVEQGADYKLTFMAKAENNKSSMRISNNWKNLDGNSSQDLSGFKGTYDWKEFVIDIKEISTARISFFFTLDSSFDGVWLDNFSLKKVENGETVGDNLMKTPGFEELYTEPELGTIGGLKAEGGDESITLSWGTTGGGSKIKLYQLMEEGYCSRGYIHPTITNATFNKLANDVEHTFAVAPVDAFGNEGELTEVSGYTVAPEFKVNAPKLHIGNSEVYGIQSGGTYKVETKVRNNKLDEAVPVTQLVALYKGNILKKLVSTSVLAEKLETGDISTSLKTNIDIPEEDYSEYHIEVFLWNSKEGMKSLYDFVTFGQAE